MYIYLSVCEDSDFYFLIYLWLCWVFSAVGGLSLVAEAGGYSVAEGGLLVVVAAFVPEHRL